MSMIYEWKVEREGAGLERVITHWLHVDGQETEYFCQKIGDDAWEAGSPDWREYAYSWQAGRQAAIARYEQERNAGSATGEAGSDLQLEVLDTDLGRALLDEHSADAYRLESEVMGFDIRLRGPYVRIPIEASEAGRVTATFLNRLHETMIVTGPAVPVVEVLQRARYQADLKRSAPEVRS